MYVKVNELKNLKNIQLLQVSEKIFRLLWRNLHKTRIKVAFEGTDPGASNGE